MRQRYLLPAALRSSLKSLRFSTDSPPKVSARPLGVLCVKHWRMDVCVEYTVQSFTPEHGYDHTQYNGHNPNDALDVSDVDGQCRRRPRSKWVLIIAIKVLIIRTGVRRIRIKVPIIRKRVRLIRVKALLIDGSALPLFALTAWHDRSPNIAKSSRVTCGFSRSRTHARTHARTDKQTRPHTLQHTCKRTHIRLQFARTRTARTLTRKRAHSRRRVLGLDCL